MTKQEFRNHIPIDRPKSLRAFTSIISVYQDRKESSGALAAAEYGHYSEAGKASHIGASCIVMPSTSDLICDIDLAARRCLTPGELAYWRMYYGASLVIVLTQADINEAGRDNQLEDHIQSFPERQWSAVASLDSRVREKLGRELIRVGISPLSRYLMPVDVRKSSKRPIPIEGLTIMAGEEFPPFEPGTISISASAEAVKARFLTPQGAADFLGGLNARTVARWAREGYIPAYPIGEGKRRLWRFLESDLEAWMLARRTVAS